MANNNIKHCEKHGKYSTEIIRISRKGKPIYAPCPVCMEEKDQEIRKWQQLEQILKRKQREIDCDIPQRYQDANFDTYIVENIGQEEVKYLAERYCELFKDYRDGGCCLTFYGFCGTGKTFLACAIARNIIRNGFSAKYSSVLKIAGEIQNTFKRDTSLSPDKIIDKYASYDLLILDEIGIQQNSNWEKNMLYELINRRYEKTLPSLLITNIHKEELTRQADPETILDKHLTQHLGSRVVDRLRENEGVTFYFNWESYRRRTYR